eukprot:scaffold755_cov101-Cylindrotheca_fusiformis.AAC.3
MVKFGKTTQSEPSAASAAEAITAVGEDVVNAGGTVASKLYTFLEDKPRVSKAVQKYVISTPGGNPEESAINGPWHFRSLFVMEATVLNIAIVFFLLFFWVINRQTHLRPTKGTKIIRKSEDDRTSSDDSSSDEDHVEDDDSEAEDELKEKESSRRRRTRNRRRLSSMQQFLSYGIEEEDDDEGVESMSELEDPEEELKSFPWSRQLHDLVRVAKTFGYLNLQALTICAKSAEYVKFQKNTPIFDTESHDGTFYAVVSGSVEVTFYDFEAPDEMLTSASAAMSGENREPFKMIVGPDKPMTSFLSFFWGMTNHFPDNQDKAQSRKHPIRVSARALEDDTEVIRINPECFARILNDFPVDVFRIIGTVLNRLQRITVQTLVTTLGLRKDLLSPPRPIPQYEKELVSSPAWKKFQEAMGQQNFCDETDLIEQATHLIRMRLGITPEMDSESFALLRDSSELIVFDGAQTLIEPGTKHESCYLLLQGSMEVGIGVPTGENEMSFHRHQMIYPGALLGEHECFTGEVSLMVIRSVPGKESVNCVLLKIPRKVYITLNVRYPKAMGRTLDSLLHQVSPPLFLLQWTSEWLNVKAAGNVAQKGAKCDSLYVVLNGRLRARKRDAASKQKTQEEYGRGKVVGEIGLLTGATWPFDVYAIRHSEIARVPVQTLLTIIHAYPKAGLNFARSVAMQIQNKASAPPRGIHPKVNPEQQIMPSYGLNLATIAVVPMDTTGINLDKFCATLTSGFNRIAPSKLVTKDSIRDKLGEKTYKYYNSAMHELRMVRRLADVEESNRLVVYQADPKFTWWTRLCIQQADCILLVVNSGRAPNAKRVEQSLAAAFESMDVRIDLVVVGENLQTNSPEGEDDEDFDLEQDEEMNVSDQLNNWSEQRKWISGHHLVRAPIGRYKQDFHRLCRRVTGRAVGLVLGAGGARGLAHLGVIKALKEAGVTIDLVGGTSQGAFVGALYARQPDDLKGVFGECRKMAQELASMKSRLLDLTLPMTSVFSGVMFNRGIRKRLGKIRIQDLVLNFFCISVDLQKQKEVVSRKGSLWKYVRASMSLTGYLPPIAEDGQLLVDGGYMNSVPADVMRFQMGARIVIAVDTNGELERDHYMWGNHLSGWWVLWNSLNPFSKTVRVPSMGDLSDMLLWVSSDQHRRNNKRLSDLYLVPPVGEYGTLEYDKMDIIVEKSYNHVKPIIDAWVKKNPWLITDGKRMPNKSPTPLQTTESLPASIPAATVPSVPIMTLSDESSSQSAPAATS